MLRMRKEFEMDDQDMRDILNNKLFKSVWGTIKGDELVTAPKGFDRDHKAIDLIRKKQYVFTKTFTDTEVLDPNFINRVNDAFKTIRPYFNYMSEVLTTDLNGVSLL